MKNRKMIAAIALTFAAGILMSRADTHYVSTNGPGPSPYTSWVTAASNIQDAVNQAVALDTVLVSNGVYNLTNRISIAANITVRSLNGTNATFVDGGYPARTNQCFYMTAGTLDGLTIRNGATTNTSEWQGGGGIQIAGANVKVLNCFILGNRITNATTDSYYSGGGGIFINTSGGSIISNCTIVSNSAPGGTSKGGGINMWAGSLVGNRVSENRAYAGGGMTIFAGTVSNCTVDNNVAIRTSGYGGGGMEIGDALIITDCVISNNLSYAAAGGVYLLRTPMRNSIITGNRAIEQGGGIFMHSFADDKILSNCVVTANISSNNLGGGIFMFGANGPGIIANCTIAGNVAKTGGAGLAMITYGNAPQLVKNCLIYGNTNILYNGGGVHLNWTGPYPYGLINCTIVSNASGQTGGGLYTIQTNYIANCIIYGNVTTNAGDVYDEVYNNTAGGASNFWYNCAPTNLVESQGNTTNNPLFIDAGNRNYRLRAGSPGINTGTNMSWTATDVDLDGRTRLRYGVVDMGCYEFLRSGTIFMIR